MRVTVAWPGDRRTEGTGSLCPARCPCARPRSTGAPPCPPDALAAPSSALDGSGEAVDDLPLRQQEEHQSGDHRQRRERQDRRRVRRVLGRERRSAQRQGLGRRAVAEDEQGLSLIHISEPTRRTPISYAV